MPEPAPGNPAWVPKARFLAVLGAGWTTAERKAQRSFHFGSSLPSPVRRWYSIQFLGTFNSTLYVIEVVLWIGIGVGLLHPRGEDLLARLSGLAELALALPWLWWSVDCTNGPTELVARAGIRDDLDHVEEADDALLALPELDRAAGTTTACCHHESEPAGPETVAPPSRIGSRTGPSSPSAEGFEKGLREGG
jgi:hypothetical protein